MDLFFSQFTVTKTQFWSISETYAFPNGTVIHDGCDHYVVEYLMEAMRSKMRQLTNLKLVC